MPEKNLIGLRVNRQIIWFTAIGAAQYLLDVLLLYGLLLSGIDITWANIFSRGLVGISGFAANRLITFHDTNTRLASSFPRFLIAWVGTSAASTLLILAALELFYGGEYTALSAVWVKIVVEVIVFIFAFLLQKYWIFSNDLG